MEVFASNWLMHAGALEDEVFAMARDDAQRHYGPVRAGNMTELLEHFGLGAQVEDTSVRLVPIERAATKSDHLHVDARIALLRQLAPWSTSGSWVAWEDRDLFNLGTVVLVISAKSYRFGIEGRRGLEILARGRGVTMTELLDTLVVERYNEARESLSRKLS